MDKMINRVKDANRNDFSILRSTSGYSKLERKMGKLFLLTSQWRGIIKSTINRRKIYGHFKYL